MKFSISILTYTELESAKKCIESVLLNSTDYELLLTANGNKEAFDYFRSVGFDNPKVHIRSWNLPENQGFIEPNRRALDKADGEFFIMLNDDATVPSGWLEMLEAPFIADPKCGLSGPQGGRFSYKLPPREAVHWLEGSCLCGLTKVLREAGLFSDYLTFATWEEIDLGFRLMAKGYTLRKVAFPIQHVGKATRRHIKGMAEIERRNRTEVARRFPQYFRP